MFYVVAHVAQVAKNISTLYILCFSFNSVNFDDMGEAFVGIGAIRKGEKGRGPGNCTVLGGSELHGKAKMNFTSLFDIHVCLHCNTLFTLHRAAI